MPALYIKDNLVLTLKEHTNYFEVLRVDNPELLPVFLQKDASTENFNKWLKMRRLPDNRDGLSEVFELFGRDRFDSQYMTGNHASLSDQYWVKWRDEGWKNVNFFTNRYPTDIGDMFFSPWTVKRKKFNTNSPDMTTIGVLKKRWKQNQDKTSFLIKSGCYEAFQDPMNEVLASVMAEQIDKIPVVHYDLCVEGTIMCNKCDNFVTANTELVPVSYFYNHEPRKEDESTFEHVLRMCEMQGIDGAENFIKWMIFIDNLTGNTDRNIGNFGFLRDVNTLKYIGPAPLYDNGNAYWDTSNITKAASSKFFGDVEAKICAEKKKELNLGFTKNKFYEKAISQYPLYSAQKKENLINAICRKNTELINDRKIREQMLEEER